MISLALGLLALTLQQRAEAPSELVVRSGETTARVPVVTTRLGPMVRVQSLLAPLGATLRQDAPDRWRLIFGPTEVALTLGIKAVRVAERTEALPAAPTMADGVLYLPFAFVAEVMPRVITGFAYDAAAGELRRFTPVTSRRLTSDSVPARTAEPNEPRSARPPPVSPRPPRRERKLVVVVDAGHGGRDHGMRGPIGAADKVDESSITLAVSRRLRAEFESRGVEVVMTRSTDTLIALDDRGRIANRARADVFVSVHVNAANPRWRDPGGSRGFETYFLAEAKTEDERRVAELENEAVKYEAEADAKNGDPLSFILNDMKQNEYLRESSDFAATVQTAIGRVHPAPSRGVKQAGFRVLVGAFMPAILVEIGFGTNRSDSAYMTSERGQKDLANAIADATMNYLARYVGRRGTGSMSNGGAR